MLWSQRTGNGPPLVLVHGFTQTHECWGELIGPLSVDHTVVAVDAPGHGHSSEIRVDLPTGASLLGATGGRAIYLGYSMGGRLCLHLALTNPGLVNALIVISASGGIEDGAARRARASLDEERAGRLEAGGLDAFLEEWLAQPMFAGIPEHARCASARRSNTVEGLASSLRLAGTGRQQPLWPVLGALAMPVLVLAGERDLPYVDQARRMGEAIGDNATIAIITGAGHAAHLERPDLVLEVIGEWLRSHPETAKPSVSRTP